MTIATLSLLSLAPISIGKMLIITSSIHTNKGIGASFEYFLWMEVLRIFGRILVSVSIINILYILFKVIFSVIDMLNGIICIVMWVIIFAIGLVIYFSYSKKKTYQS